MAKKRPQYKLASVGLSDGDRNVLVSAINSFASALASEFTWSDANEADIHIVDVTQSGTTDYPVVVRYTGRKNGQPVDIWRPIRAQTLIDALDAASERVAEYHSSASPGGSTVRRYRGAIVEDAGRSAPSTETAARKPRGVTYRGHRIE